MRLFTEKNWQMNWILCVFWITILVLPIKSQHLDDDLCGCYRNQSKAAFRIFNGTAAGKNEFSFVANIFFSSKIVESIGPQERSYRLFESVGTAVILNSQWFLSVRSGRPLLVGHKTFMFHQTNHRSFLSKLLT